MTDLITSGDVAEHFGVTMETVNRWVREGKVPFLRPSRRVVRFRLKDVERALAEAASPASAHTSKGAVDG